MHRTVLSYKIHTVAPYINWIYFFHAWGFQPRFAAITNIHGCDACRAVWLTTFPDEERNKASEALQLFKEANRMLDKIAYLEKEGRIHVIRPDRDISAKPVERDPAHLKEIYEVGRRVMKADMEKLKAYLAE